MVREGGKPALPADRFVTSLRDAIGREGAAPQAVAESVDYTPAGEVIVQEGVLRGVISKTSTTIVGLLYRIRRHL